MNGRIAALEQRILIIDAHPEYIRKLENFLKGLTFQHITLARSRGEALECLEQMNPGLIIMSGTLPDGDAKELCRQLRVRAQADTKIIVQVGLRMDADRAWFLLNGADAVLDRLEKDLAPLESAVTAALGI